jgi:enterobacterial common antigen flippase
MISKETITTVGVRILTIVLGFITSIITARFLGPAGRGDYFLVTTLAMLLTQFSHLGLASSNTYLVASQHDLFPKLLANSFWISLILGFLIALAALLILNLTHVQYPHGTWVLLLLVPVSLFFLLGINLLIGMNKISRYNIFQLGSSVLLVCFITLAGISGGHVYSFLLISLLGWTIVAIILFINLMYLSPLSCRTLRFSQACFLQGASYGVKAYLITLIGMLVLKSNVLLLRYFSTEDVLGYYSIASQLNDCLVILPASIGLILFPNLVRNTDNRWKEMKKSLYLTAGMMLLSCLLAAILVKPFIRLAFGVDFLPAVNIFYWMLPGAFFLGLITIVSQYISAIGLPRLIVIIWFITFIIMMGSSCFLIPRYTGEGAAMALSAAYFILFGMIGLLAKNQHRRLH